MDVVRKIRDFNADREPERRAIKLRLMRATRFAFLRGTCHLFYDRLHDRGVPGSAPAAWICGDLHLENFGSYKGDNRLVYFDLNDFDEAALAPASWELIRLLTSLRVAAAELSIKSDEAEHLCRSFVDAYAAALALGKPLWIERETAHGLVRELLDDLRERPRKAFLDARTRRKGRQRQILIDGRHALAASEAQRKQVGEFMAAFAHHQDDPDFFRVIDVARRIAGTGSLGVDRYMILVNGKGSPDANYLLDLKAATPCALAPHLRLPQPNWKNEAERIVALQRRLQAVSMAFLQPVLLGRKSFVLRALQPVEDRISIDRTQQSLDQLDHAIATLGRLVAWAQLRSAGRGGSAPADELVDFGRRRKWRARLLEASIDCAAQVEADAAAYAKAYDAGAFNG
ncbi:MAG: DUF2252 family protein [Burkholderiales bacterium]|nr:DUF2252 family protein [Burkholderiales bacterium]